MTKRRDILKQLKIGAKQAGVRVEIVEGGRHTLVILDGLRVPVGRHNEIDNSMATIIYKEAEPKLGKDWWKK